MAPGVVHTVELDKGEDGAALKVSDRVDGLTVHGVKLAFNIASIIRVVSAIELSS